MLQRFIKDQRGIFWVILVGTITIMVATGVWLIAMLVTGSFVTLFGAQATGPYTLQFGESVQTQGAIVVVIIDVGMVVWMTVSAFRRESQEDMMPL